MCYLLKKYFWWLLRRVKNLRSMACKHYRKCDVIYRYLHIELIWCLLMVQYLQNNVIMKWTTRFIRFTGWIPLKYGSTTTPPIIAQCQNTPMSSLAFHIAIPKTSNIRRTPSFDLLTDEFSKRVYYKTRLILETRRYVSLNYAIIGSDNGLTPDRCQTIIWTNAWILLIRPLGTNFSESLSKIQNFSFMEMHLKTSPAKWQPFCSREMS